MSIFDNFVVVYAFWAPCISGYKPTSGACQ